MARVTAGAGRRIGTWWHRPPALGVRDPSDQNVDHFYFWIRLDLWLQGLSRLCGSGEMFGGFPPRREEKETHSNMTCFAAVLLSAATPPLSAAVELNNQHNFRAI